ncbi:hypothetical protein MED121_18345 [Marinomonas sp. MED121]|uniref:hypothetical protein n=1 Tax=Marinomonas sp. MED121 TaxID=314277 RepID=UPI0000690D04|nr:hypothetical protein [Marinomonas sp. MED121]EAQ65228.1 hypothetical protein MED121_18345 [Marinomonas sp. MED121]
MANKFEPVQADDFMKFGGERPSYLLIEDELMAMGGLGVTGNQFKKEVLKAAGWTGGALTTYAQRPAVAAASFNRIREALENGVADGVALKASLEG